MSKKYHIVVFGCQMNRSDAERVAGVLESAKLKNTPKIHDADLIVVVMCSVRQSSVDRVHYLAHKFKNLRAKTVLTGCVLKKDKKMFMEGFDFVLNIRKISKIPELARQQIRSVPRKAILHGSPKAKNCRELSETRAGGANASEGLLPSDYGNYLDIAPKYTSKFSANVPIMTGCNNFCAYCVVPYTRDREISRPAKEIVCEVKNLIKNGYKEIWLLGQNVNSYKSGQINFPKLLKMANDIPGKFVLNFTSSHPKDFSDELIETMVKCKKLSRDLNLPIQSGDDEILKRMNRPYTAAQYKILVKKIREALPNVRLSTDIIVGFPGETKKQFNNTVKTLKDIGYGVAFINKYSPRAGTAANKMKDNVPWAEKKRREKILIDLINAKPACQQADKLIVILGPTASGKTDLAIKLAKKFNGEVVSADSRQIYKGMDIGTAKPNLKFERTLRGASNRNSKFTSDGVVHWLVDIKNPDQLYTVAEFKNDAVKIIKDIQKRGKLPILCGGTGLYIKAVVDNLDIPKVQASPKLRKKIEKEIEKKGLNFVFNKLLKLDPEAAYIIDPKNPRRVIRAMEVTLLTKKPFSSQRKAGNPLFDILQIGIFLPNEKLKERMNSRVDKMVNPVRNSSHSVISNGVKNGLIKEVKKLITKFGQNQQAFDAIGYREIIDFLNGKITLDQAVLAIKTNTWHFAKRQMTWFKRDSRIIWVNNLFQAQRAVKNFLKN